MLDVTAVAVIAAVAGQRLSRVMIVRHFASNVSFAPVDQFFGVFLFFTDVDHFCFGEKFCVSEKLSLLPDVSGLPEKKLKRNKLKSDDL